MPKRNENLSNKLNLLFYLRNDVVLIANELIGKVLVTNIDGKITKGIIVETEAYCGRNDKACHANNGLRTKRTKVMYARGGVAYVYLCYGIHHLFNIVTNEAGKADAVLIRALQALEGKDYMKERTKSPRLTNGPGILSKAMGITTAFTGIDLLENKIWVENRSLLSNEKIIATKRIGVNSAKEDANLPWRFHLQGNQWVSR